MKSLLASCLNIDLDTLSKQYKITNMSNSGLVLRHPSKLFVPNSEHLTIKGSLDHKKIGIVESRSGLPYNKLAVLLKNLKEEVLTAFPILLQQVC